MASIVDIQHLFIYFLLWLVSTLFLRQFIFKKTTAKPNSTGHHFSLPPSPPSLPVIGHLHYLKPYIYKCLHDLCTKYGPLLHVRFGSYSFVLVSSASLAKEIFKTYDLNFASKPPSSIQTSIALGQKGFVFAPYGDYWRFMKKLMVTELLGARQLQRSRNVRREELVHYLRKVMEKAQSNDVIDLERKTVTLANNVTCRMVMSTRCSGEESKAEMCRELVKESLELAGKMTLATLLGPFRKLGLWFLRKQSLDVLRRYDELMDKLLEEHEERAKRCDDNGGGVREDDQDLMDILLRVYHDEHAEFKISRRQVKAFFADLFFAGTNTSANAMQWIMAELINHPNEFKKVREEIESTVRRSRLVEEPDIPNLHFLQAVVMETLRLHPAGPAIPRLCREDCKIGGFDIPKGTRVGVNIYSIMRDQNLWDKPNKFCPERFLMFGKDEAMDINEKERMRQNFGSLTFGGGRRRCPGMNLALILIVTSVAAMVQCFDWRVNGDGDKERKVNVEVKKGVTLSVAHPLLCRPVVHFNPFTS